VMGEAFHVWQMAGDAVPEARQAVDSICQFVSHRWQADQLDS
jgi:hypothetical protein